MVGGGTGADAASRLGVADLVEDGSKTAEQIARSNNAHTPSVLRLLRALGSLDIFSEDAEG